MPLLPTPALSHAEKDALIAALTARLALADQRIAALEARNAGLEARIQPASHAKTPDNSSLPPSKGQKPELPPAPSRPPRKSRPGVGRTLHPEPDRVVDARLLTPARIAPPPSPSSADAAAGLRPHRVATDQAGRHPGAAVRRPLRLLREHGSPRRPRPGWNPARRSVSRSRPWWSICTTPMRSAWNGWSC